MEISIAKTDLEQALAALRISVGSADLSGHALFRITASGAEAQTFSQRRFTQVPLVATVSGDVGSAFTVEFWRLEKFVSAVADGVLTLKGESQGSVSVSGPRSTIRLRSLDPSKWPSNDGMVSSAVSQDTVNAGDLLKAFSQVRNMVSTNDTHMPKLCMVDVRKGLASATDSMALSLAAVPSEALDFRIPTSEIATFMRFLSLDPEAPVEVQSSSRPNAEGGGTLALFRFPSGMLFGVMQPAVDYRYIPIDRKEPKDNYVTLDRQDLESATALLLAGAPKGHETIKIVRRGDQLLAAMPCEAGGEDEYLLANSRWFSTDPNPGFQECRLQLGHLADPFRLFKQDALVVGMELKGSSGVSLIRVKTEEDDYFQVISWVKG